MHGVNLDFDIPENSLRNEDYSIYSKNYNTVIFGTAESDRRFLSLTLRDVICGVPFMGKLLDAPLGDLSEITSGILLNIAKFDYFTLFPKGYEIISACARANQNKYMRDVFPREKEYIEAFEQLYQIVKENKDIKTIKYILPSYYRRLVSCRDDKSIGVSIANALVEQLIRAMSFINETIITRKILSFKLADEYGDLKSSIKDCVERVAASYGNLTIDPNKLNNFASHLFFDDTLTSKEVITAIPHLIE